MKYTTDYGSLMALTQSLKGKQSAWWISNKKFIVFMIQLSNATKDQTQKAFKWLKDNKFQEKLQEEFSFEFKDEVNIDVSTSTDQWFDLWIASALVNIFWPNLKLSIDGELQQLD